MKFSKEFLTDIRNGVIGSLVAGAIMYIYNQINLSKLGLNWYTYLFFNLIYTLVVFFVAYFVIFHLRIFEHRVFKRIKLFFSRNKELELFRFNSSVSMFADRLASVMPAVQNKVVWYEKMEAVSKLNNILKRPLQFSSSSGGIITPIWWFRDGVSIPISKYKKLDGSKIILEISELDISKIAIYRGRQERYDFVYIEVSPMSPTGVYKYNEDELRIFKEERGYTYEEFGLYKGKFKFSRQEYDDGYLNYKNKIVSSSGSELRIRFTSKYNFILTSQDSVYNYSRKFDFECDEYFDKLLDNEIDFNDFLNFMLELKPDRRV